MGWGIIIAVGTIFGLGAVLLVSAGNPGNYGFCAACQLRDIAGALGMHQAAALQYARPEILGFILGSFSLARLRGEFRPRGGARPAVRFVLGAVMMLGALVFLGCPLRGVLRLAGGDLNGLTALAGFVAGVGAGTYFLKNGYTLGQGRIKHSNAGQGSGYLAVIAAIVLLAGVAGQAGFLKFSAAGPGSLHAPWMISLAAGLAGGIAAQYSGMCMSGGVRNFMLTKDTYLLKIYGVMLVSAALANVYFGFFKLSFEGQPLAHTMHLWNFLGLFAVGMAAILAGGCPLRQLILAGEGNTDAMFCILGMLTGAGLAHTLNLAGSAAGVSVYGQAAVIAAIVIAAAIGVMFKEKAVNIHESA